MTSIRRRVLLPLLLFNAGILLLAALAIEAGVRRDLVRSLERRLLILAQQIGASVDVKVDGTLVFDPEPGTMDLFGGPTPSGLFRVARSGGEVIASSTPGPDLAGEAPGPSAAFSVRAVGREEYRFCHLSIIRNPEGGQDDVREWMEKHPGSPLPPVEPVELRIAVGVSEQEIRLSLASLRARLAAAFGGLLAALTLLPVWALGRGLAPLRRLAAQAEAVGPESPRVRLPEAGVDREVRPLVTSLNRALDRLAAAYENERRFTADAAHELRTPIASIRAHSEVALRKPRPAAELREALEAVHRTALRLGTLVEALLALARFSTEGTELRNERLDLSRLARDAARLHEVQAQARGVELVAADSDEIPALGDPALLLNCVSALVENAVRYTPPGGRVRIACGRDPRPWLVVEDTGPGIPEEHLGRIFDRFYRVNPARSRADGGAGLGLAIAQEIARLHCGEIVVASRLGEGSRFELHLPALPDQGETP